MVAVGVVGATGQVGELMRKVLTERRFPVSSIRFFASPRSAGTELEWDGGKVVVEDAATASYNGLAIVLMSGGAQTSRELAGKITGEGAIVVDNSSAWRMDPEVPLVVSEVNPEALTSIPKGIVANPNCTTMVAMPVLAPLHARAGLEKMVAATYQAVSGAGRAGVSELADQLETTAGHTEELTFNPASLDYPPAAEFAAPIAHNVVPLAGKLAGDGSLETDEEQKLRNESRKILGIPDLAVSVTCVRVPVFTGHSLALHLGFAEALGPEEATSIISQAPGVRLEEIPTPLLAAGGDVTVVGRIRRDQALRNGLALFLAGDNLRKGAALNAVQIAELIVGIR